MREQSKFYYKHLINQIRRIFNYDSNLEKRKALLFAAAKQIGTYTCANCGGVFPRHEVAVDHKITVMPLSGFDSWSGVISRLFCSAEDLQVLCKKPCHAEKSRAENAERRRLKKEREE